MNPDHRVCPADSKPWTLLQVHNWGMWRSMSWTQQQDFISKSMQSVPGKECSQSIVLKLTVCSLEKALPGSDAFLALVQVAVHTRKLQ